MYRKLMALCLTVFLVSLAIVAHAEEKSPKREVSERLIVQIDSSSWVKESFEVSPECKHVAYVAKVGDKWFMVVDGKEEKKYDGIIAISPFSPDSKRVAYVAVDGDKCFAVVDGKEERKYDDIVAPVGRWLGGWIIFDSPDSLHYLARKGNSIYLVEERIRIAI